MNTNILSTAGGQERSTCGKRNGETIEIRPEAGDCPTLLRKSKRHGTPKIGQERA